jgi:hypothetical protein
LAGWNFLLCRIIVGSIEPGRAELGDIRFWDESRLSDSSQTVSTQPPIWLLQSSARILSISATKMAVG